MACYVLVCAGQSDADGSVEARQVFEKLLLLLLTERFWPHGQDGREPQLLHAGDRVLFCLASSRGPELIGDATASSPSAPLAERQLAECRLYLGPAMPPGPGALTHAVVLERARVWEQSLTVTDDDSPAAFDLARTLGGLYRPGAVRPISDESYQWVMSRQEPLDRPAPLLAQPAEPPAPRPPIARVAPTPPPRPPAQPQGAEATRAFLAAYWRHVDFGERLEPLIGDSGGRSITTPAGPIDLACRSADTGDLLALLCIDGEPVEEVRSSVAERLTWARENLAEDGQRVRGVLILTGSGPDAKDLVGPGVEVRRLQIACAAPADLPGPAPVPEPDAAEDWDLPGSRPFAGVPSERPPTMPVPAPPEALATVPSGPASPRTRPVALDFATKCRQVPRGGRNGVVRPHED